MIETKVDLFVNCIGKLPSCTEGHADLHYVEYKVLKKKSVA